MSDFENDHIRIGKCFNLYMNMSKESRKRLLPELLDVLLRDEEYEFLFQAFDDVFHSYNAERKYRSLDD